MSTIQIISIIFIIIAIITYLVLIIYSIHYNINKKRRRYKDKKAIKRIHAEINEKNEKLDIENRRILETYMNNKINNIPQPINEEFEAFIKSDININDYIKGLRIPKEILDKYANSLSWKSVSSGYKGLIDEQIDNFIERI